MAKMTAAQKRAALKYQKSLGQISIRLPKSELTRYKRAAEKTGMSFRAWVLERLNEGIDTGKAQYAHKMASASPEGQEVNHEIRAKNG